MIKFSIDKNKFLEKLLPIQGIAERRATMPILSHVLLSCSRNTLTVTATDLETTLTTWTEAEIEEESSLSVPARKLFEIIRELSEGKIRIEEIKNNWIQLSTESGNYRIAGLPGEDFPIVPDVSTDKFIEIESEALDDLLSKTIYCVSPDDLRRNLSGIYFEKAAQNKLKLVATDGHRLSLVEKEFSGDINIGGNVLVPRKAVSELRKVLKQGELVKIGCEKNFFITMGEEMTLYSRLIDADFPDYKQVLPDNTPHELRLEKDSFMAALKRVTIFSSEKTRSVKINFEKDMITLTSVSPEVGEATESINTGFDGDPREIGFNGNYLIDAIETIEDETINFGMTDELSPTVIKPASKKGHVCVVMPMRV